MVNFVEDMVNFVEDMVKDIVADEGGLAGQGVAHLAHLAGGGGLAHLAGGGPGTPGRWGCLAHLVSKNLPPLFIISAIKQPKEFLRFWPVGDQMPF